MKTNPTPRQQKPPTPRPGWGGRGSTYSWRQLRVLVIRRDGHRCGNCGKQTHPRCSTRGCDTCTHVGHYPTPRAEGGADHPSNLRVECQRCNLVASARRSTAIRAAKQTLRAVGRVVEPLKTSRRW